MKYVWISKMNLIKLSKKLIGLHRQNLTTSSFGNSAGSTIYSLCSGFGKCGISVIRVSGPETKSALKSIIGSEFQPKPRHAYLKSLYYPINGEMIDKGLVLFFAGPSSFTGEDSCEFHVHGSIAVIEAMLTALGSIRGLRPAAAGEFTKRAFFGGKLDLTEVDGLADLIHAETEAQRKQALLQTTGSLARLYDDWRKRLIRCCAHLEAYIDFADEENIESNVVKTLTDELLKLTKDIKLHLDDQRKGEMLRDGVRTIILGPPNVGKSSFLNLMCQRSVSIVTPIAGTTRDIIETTHNIGGFPVVFSDTAGLRRHTQDCIEVEGISRARSCLETADLVLLIIDAQQLKTEGVSSQKQMTEFIEKYKEELSIDDDILEGKTLQIIINKIDLLEPQELENLRRINNDFFYISCSNSAAEQLKSFMEEFGKVLKELCGQPNAENPRITHARYRQQLERCIEHINIFLEDYSPEIYPDLAVSAQKLRHAVRCIERITGHVSSDDILDVVFKDFCIGK